MKRLLTYLIVTVIAVFSASAQGEHLRKDTVIVDIPFSLSGGDENDIRRDIDSVALANSMRELDLINADKSLRILSIEFYSSVSPEGTYVYNKKLGAERLATAERIVRERLHIDEAVTITRKSRFIPWLEYLKPSIEADVDIPYRDTLLKIVSRTPKPFGRDCRRRDLMRAYDGALYEIVKERYFDYIRRGGAVIIVERTIQDEILVEREMFGGVEKNVPFEMLAFEKIEPAVEPVVEQVPEKMHAVSIKTNAAAVAALITNIGVEIKLAPRWSLDLMGAYSPYNMIVSDRKIRLFGGRPEVRYWWGDVMKRGHFLGLHGFASAFNVQLGDKARYQDPNHVLWGAGLAYGYAMPLGKKERWGVEFTLGLGYARIKYDKYAGGKNGPFIESKTVNYFGPTRVGVNFSYRFDIEGKSKNRVK